MFWKTALNHAGEILLAFGGVWILGYLWNRWFGSKTDPRQIAEYEDQIKSLRDRIKIQDQEIKAGLVRQDAWTSEITDLRDSNIDLKNKLQNIDLSYNHHISPEKHKELQDHHEYELKLKQDQITALTAQRDNLFSSLQAREEKLKLFQIQEEEFSLNQSKLEIAESRLEESRAAINNLEHQLRDLTEQNNLLKGSESDLEASTKTLENLSLKNKELEKYIEDLIRENQDLVIQVKEERQNSEQTRTITKEQESQYLDKLQSRDSEILRLQAQLAAPPSADHLSFDEISRELQDARSELDALRLRLKESEARSAGSGEKDPESAQSIQDALIINQNLNNELEAAKNELKDLNLKLNNYATLEKTVDEWTAKSKEWEARWKDASKDSEQFRVAHASLIKERDGQRQHLAQLEADILQFNTVFRDYESKEEQWRGQIDELTRQRDQLREDYETKWNTARQELSEVSKKLNDNHDGWVKKYEALQDSFNIIQKQLNEADQNKDQLMYVVHELEQKLKYAEADLVEQKQKLAESISVNQSAHKEAEWDLVLKSKEEELKHAQQSIAELVISNESKLTRLNEAELRIPEMEAAHSGLRRELAEVSGKLEIQERLRILEEEKNENLHHELQLAKAQLAELNQLKESQAAALGNWEQRYAESQNILEVNRQLFAENEKNNQAMETLVSEWEKKYHTVQNELLDVRHQLADFQQLQDSRDNLESDRDQRRSDLESILEDSRIQMEESRVEQNVQRQLAEEWENKYNELYSRFNIVQLQFADTQRIKSHLDSDLRKMTDYQAKYLAESKNWQKRLAEIEADFNDRLAAIAAHSGTTPESPPPPPQASAPAIMGIKNEWSADHIEYPKLSVVAGPVQPKINKDYKLAARVFEKKVTENDHKLIEGIGPKISAMLKRNKITTWQMLSQLPAKNIQVLLDQAGTKFALADPRTWPTQAKLADQGKWEKLKKFQDKLKLNQKKSRRKSKPPAKAPVVTSASAPKPPKKVRKKVLPKPKPINLSASRAIFGQELKLNDLKVIEGIGPKIEKLLNKAEIMTWSTLAKTKLRPLRAILKKAGNKFRLADPKTWSAQARLASKGQWKRLKTMQDKLNSRK